MPLPAPATGRGTSPVATTDTRPASAAPPRPAAAPPPAGDVVASRPVPAAAVGSEGQAGVAGIGGAGRQADPGDSEAAPAPGNPAPAYPLAALALLRVVVSPDGVGRDIRLAESSGTVALDLAAVEAIRTWRFVPARRAGQATEDVILVPVVFRLTQ